MVIPTAFSGSFDLKLIKIIRNKTKKHLVQDCEQGSVDLLRLGRLIFASFLPMLRIIAGLDINHKIYTYFKFILISFELTSASLFLSVLLYNSKFKEFNPRPIVKPNK